LNVTIYTTSTCGWCQRTKQYLTSHGFPFVEKRVDEDYAAAMEMVRLSGQESVPVTTVDGQVVIGFDRARLDVLLSSADTGKVAFGASIADAARVLSRQGQVPIFGALVGKVAPDSPAARVGLEPGDIISEMNLRPVTRADDVVRALAGLGRGDRLAVGWTRGERSLAREVNL
jgi:glutaredoxin-like YruB-family protein